MHHCHALYLHHCRKVETSNMPNSRYECGANSWHRETNGHSPISYYVQVRFVHGAKYAFLLVAVWTLQLSILASTSNLSNTRPCQIKKISTCGSQINRDLHSPHGSRSCGMPDDAQFVSSMGYVQYIIFKKDVVYSTKDNHTDVVYYFYIIHYNLFRLSRSTIIRKVPEMYPADISGVRWMFTVITFLPVDSYVLRFNDVAFLIWLFFMKACHVFLPWGTKTKATLSNTISLKPILILFSIYA